MQADVSGHCHHPVTPRWRWDGVCCCLQRTAHALPFVFNGNDSVFHFLFLVTWPWPLTFDLDTQTRLNTSSLWIWHKSVQRFLRYLSDKQKNKENEVTDRVKKRTLLACGKSNRQDPGFLTWQVDVTSRMMYHISCIMCVLSRDVIWTFIPLCCSASWMLQVKHCFQH